MEITENNENASKYDGYRDIASVYDKLNEGIDYKGWADFFEKCFDKWLENRPELVLDLACGTGTMTIELAKRGYDMMGIDASEDMLSVAFERKFDAELTNILYLSQDMRSFELYGTVGAVVCCLDSLNYLTGDGELDRCFSLVHNYLDPDGLFLFDMNTPYKFDNVYAGNSYILESENAFCGWQNAYDPESRLCEFRLSLFEDDGNGKYVRSDEVQYERCYEKAEIIKSLEANGFELLGFFAGFDFEAPDENTERWYIAARAKK